MNCNNETPIIDQKTEDKNTDYDSDEEEEQQCDCCGTTCLDHNSNKGRGSESPCPICEEYRCSLCPCDC